jgi:hypothetical protein
MSTISNVLPQQASQPKIWGRMLALTIALAVLAFLASPNGPLGSFWRPSPDEPMPTSTQLPFFIVLNLAEVLTFGFGTSFLVFGFPLVRAIAPASQTLTRLAHISISWLLLNWWVHDSLHLHNGMNLNGLIGIEYGFHISLMIAGVILAYFFYTLLQGRTTSR